MSAILTAKAKQKKLIVV